MKDKLLHWKRTTFAVLLTLLLSAVGVTNATAQTFTVGDLNYSVNEDGVSVTVTGHVDGQEATGELVIPESVSYYNTQYVVTIIGEGAFSWCNQITSLVIGNSVQLIGNWAFESCSGITSVEIPSSVTDIWSWAFASTGLTSITIPSQVTYIGGGVFASCHSLTSLNYNATNSYLESVNGHWLTDCPSLTTLTIGENVQAIPDNFLNGCSTFTGELVIPESVIWIGENAFSNCSGFAGSLTIPNFVETIGASAFSSCTGFSGTLTIGSSVSEIGNSAFFGTCENFTLFDVKAETPPTLGTNVFTSVDYGIPVQVPCGSLDAYNNASGWDEFTNIQEPDPCLWEITVTVNPEEGGTISGAGTLEQGTTCTLTATPNEGYVFVNWTEDGMEVSVDEEYSFIVEGNRNLVANFIMPVFTITATANPSNGGEISTTDVIVDFEDEQIPVLWINDNTFPWTVTTSAYSGYYCIMSGNGGVDSSTSSIETTVDFVTDGFIEFYCRISSESGCDFGHFYIDDVEQFSESGETNWTLHSFEVTAGSHNFRWSYSKDISVHTGDDCYKIDHITFMGSVINASSISSAYYSGHTCTLTATPSDYYSFVNWTEDDEVVSSEATYTFTVEGDRNLVANFYVPTFTITATANPSEGGEVRFGNYFDFEDGSLQGWTAIDADGDGRNWYVRSDSYGDSFDLFGHSGSYFVASFSYYGGAINPDNYLVSPELANANQVQYYVAGQPSYRDHYGVYASTTGNDLSDFFLVFEETIPASKDGMEGDNSMKAKEKNRNVSPTPWFERMVELPQGTKYIAFRHFNSYDKYFVILDDISFPTTRETNVYVQGSTCSLTAIPNYGYGFVNWTENGDEVSTDAAYSFVVTNDRNLVANFTKVPFAINATPNFDDRGTVSGAGEYVLDALCTLTATPAEGHSFVRWTENGEEVSTEAVYSFTVTGPRDLVAVFSPMQGTYIVFADPNVETICLNHWDADGDGFLSYEEAAAVTSLDNVFEYNHEITSFNELQYFTGLTYINDYEFYYCQNLTSVVLPETVTSIGYEAFLNCHNLGGTLTINENVTYIGWGAFYSTNFSTLHYNAVNCEMGGQWLAAATASLTTLTIGENVEVIPIRAFEDFYNVAGPLVIPNSVTYIGTEAFNNCRSFTSITIPEGITTIEYGTFNNCWSAETVNLPSTLDTIGHLAFRNCYSLTSIEFPNTLSYIGSMAFEYCSALAGVLEIPAPVTYIGDEAFVDCSSLTGLMLPDGLQFIGYRAFQNCSGLRGALTLSESLEFVGNNAFAGCDGFSTVNYNAISCQTMGSAGEPVFYDCSFANLRIGENVDTIPDFAFKHCFLITDISSGAVNPPTIFASTFGMVSRSIPVHVPVGSGEAYRNAPYWEEFFNIIEDYSPSQYTCHWSTNPNQFESNMSVIGIIQIDGEEQATDALEIGAFCGNECRGSQLLAYYPQVDRYLVFLTLYGEPDDLLSFRLYDHEAEEEIPLGCESYVTFEADGRLGTLDEPYPFNFTSLQMTQLPQGWTWWSSYIELEGIDGLAQMEESLGENGITIKSRNDGFVSNDGGIWAGSLTSVNNENTYLIQTAAACMMTVTGDMASASAHPITLPTGWSWIGYPCNTSMSINQALSNLEAEADDVLKSQEAFSVYDPDNGWVGSLLTIMPGMGLMYESHSTSNLSFAYPSAKSEATDENITARENHWKPNYSAYPNNMSFIAVVELDGEELQSDRYELAAFANDGCRGSAKLMHVDATNRYMAFLTVFGESTASLYFGLYDTETGMELVANEEEVEFVANAVVGGLKAPRIIRFRDITSMDEWANNLHVYPNPTERGQMVSLGLTMDETAKVQVEIINAFGVVESRHATSLPTIKAPNAAGVYTLRITVEGQGTCCKKLIVR